MLILLAGRKTFGRLQLGDEEELKKRSLIDGLREAREWRVATVWYVWAKRPLTTPGCAEAF